VTEYVKDNEIGAVTSSNLEGALSFVLTFAKRILSLLDSK
jgi:hypothetical protein